MLGRITKISFSEKFKDQYGKLSPDIKDQAKESIVDLAKDPRPARIRFEKLTGYKNPSIYTIHATRNHSHKISFELNGTEALLRQIATHKEIDRRP